MLNTGSCSIRAWTEMQQFERTSYQLLCQRSWAYHPHWIWCSWSNHVKKKYLRIIIIILYYISKIIHIWNNILYFCIKFPHSFEVFFCTCCVNTIHVVSSASLMQQAQVAAVGQLNYCCYTSHSVWVFIKMGNVWFYTW